MSDARIQEIRLTLENPEEAHTAVALDWTYPAGEKVSYFEVYQTFNPDSLGAAVKIIPVTDTTSAVVRLPDISTPFTIYYGVRAVLVEPTGQKLFGKTVPVESLMVNPAATILTPAARSLFTERAMTVEVKAPGDAGINLRQLLYDREPGGWKLMLDTCLPMNACGIPIFGSAPQRDDLVLQGVPPGDTLESLYCVFGDESFEDTRTGRKQSLDCTRFSRTNP